eukprot:scaffold394_cov112-Isochrysis_galbana.AAC.3
MKYLCGREKKRVATTGLEPAPLSGTEPYSAALTARPRHQLSCWSSEGCVHTSHSPSIRPAACAALTHEAPDRVASRQASCRACGAHTSVPTAATARPVGSRKWKFSNPKSLPPPQTQALALTCK